MCGRFTQYSTREEYLSYLADDIQTNIPYDPVPVGRYNVAPGTNVLLLNERDTQLYLDPVHWGYAPGWWDKPPLINARAETAANSRMFKSLWNRGRAIVFADGWYEWKKEGSIKQPYYIYRKDQKPLLFACIGSTPFQRRDESEGFLIITAGSNEGLVDIHDRRPLALTPAAARQWLSSDLTSEDAQKIATNHSVPENAFKWHAVSRAVGNVHNQGQNLIKATEA
jgi:putative SOS response-associated peptidase YedK